MLLQDSSLVSDSSLDWWTLFLPLCVCTHDVLQRSNGGGSLFGFSTMELFYLVTMDGD